jgi:hypothetical protein
MPGVTAEVTGLGSAIMPVAQPEMASDARVTAEAATRDRDESLKMKRSDTGASKKMTSYRLQFCLKTNRKFQCEPYTCLTTVVKRKMHISFESGASPTGR